MQVLIIEDSEDDFQLIRRFVSKMSHIEIEWRASLKQGLVYLESHPVDVLLLDMALPDGNGLGILAQLQTRFPLLPIIILSGYASDKLALEAVRLGAQDYLLKGQFNGEMLGRALRYAVERKRLEERLRRSEELYRIFASNFPNGALLLYDHDLRYTLVDGLGLQELGLSKEKMEGKTLWDVFPVELAAEGEIRMKTALAGKSHNEEIVYAGQTILMNYVPVRDSSGIIVCGMIMAQNITQRKQLEAQTLELEVERRRMSFLRRFINDMSHDFRTPLTIINSSLYLLQKISDPENQQVQVQKVKQQILRMDQLLSELLQMNYLDDKKTTFHFTPTEMNTFLASLVHKYESLAHPKRITIKFIPADIDCFAQIDTQGFMQAFSKILDNAIAYTPEGGSIRVYTKLQDSQIILRVQDTGIGIAAQHLPHIFERFYRADSARSSQSGGSGLGLAMVQQIIEAHGGKVEVESSLGEGSSFWIKLPAV